MPTSPLMLPANAVEAMAKDSTPTRNDSSANCHPGDHLAPGAILSSTPEAMVTESNAECSSSIRSSSFENTLKSAFDNTNNTSEEVNTTNETVCAVEETRVFTCFPKLPPEVRRMIWKEACLVERVLDIWTVPIKHENWIDEMFGNVNCSPPFSYRTHCKHPAVLHVSRESRTVGLENYCLSFDTKSKIKVHGFDFKITSPAKIYVNWEHDLICPLQPPTIIDNLDPLFVEAIYTDWKEKIPKIRRIAIDSEREKWIKSLEKSSVVREILLYEDHIERFDHHMDFNKAEPVTFSFADYEVDDEDENEDEDEDNPAYYDWLLEAASGIRSKFETRFSEGARNGCVKEVPLSHMPIIRIVKRDLISINMVKGKMH